MFMLNFRSWQNFTMMKSYIYTLTLKFKVPRNNIFEDNNVDWYCKVANVRLKTGAGLSNQYFQAQCERCQNHQEYTNLGC